MSVRSDYSIEKGAGRMINSIEITTMLPRTAEAADLQGRENSQLQHAADQPAIQFQNMTKQEASKTVETQKSEAEEYDLDDSASGGAGGRSGRRGKKKKEEKQAPMAPRSDSSFDIMV